MSSLPTTPRKSSGPHRSPWFTGKLKCLGIHKSQNSLDTSPLGPETKVSAVAKWPRPRLLPSFHKTVPEKAPYVTPTTPQTESSFGNGNDISLIVRCFAFVVSRLSYAGLGRDRATGLGAPLLTGIPGGARVSGPCPTFKFRKTKKWTKDVKIL